MRKTLIIVGLTLLAIGLAWPWLSLIPLGRLPGDIVIERDSCKLYFPITTMIIISALLSFIIWLFRQ